METNKIIGYVLLTIGVLLVVSPLWQTYNIFTGHATPPQVFIKPIALQIDQQASPLDIQKQIQNALIKVVPIDFINNTLNLASWLLLGFILMYGGGKIAEIGVKLVK
ncbi:MAG: hypothetical protein WCK10_00640 [Candidatus Staskawiczbacteria bacterium]